MNLISLYSLVLVVVTYLICFFIPKKYRWVILLISSIFFYYFAGWQALITMIAVSLFSFLFGLLIERLSNESKWKKITLISGIVVITAWLVTIKYSIGYGWGDGFIIIPLGASYVSFSVISYWIDIYWERDKADRNVLKHVLYVMCFLKITEGPISRHNKMSPTLYDGGDMTYKNLCFGSQRLLYGLFKKIVIADRLAMITSTVFSNLSNYSGSVILIAILFAAFELYFDFSGYMDIILGFSQTLGIETEENFKHPFFSKSAAEFWRRWHITLGAWFRDYVYNPIVMSRPIKKLGKITKNKFGRNIGNAIVKSIAILVVWVLTGLWHGLTLNYLFWGLMWGTIIIISTFLEGPYKRITSFLHINTESPTWKAFQMVRTFFIFCIGILFARTYSPNDIGTVTYQIFNNFQFIDMVSGKLFDFGISHYEFLFLLVCMAFTLFIAIIQEKRDVREYIGSFNIPVRWILFGLGLFVVLYFGLYGSGYSTNGFAYAYF